MTKRRDHRLPEPFEHVRVDVSPIGSIGKPPDGLAVGVMNLDMGRGSRSSLEYAEAEAETVLKAIRAYRRAHPEPTDPAPSLPAPEPEETQCPCHSATPHHEGDQIA